MDNKSPSRLTDIAENLRSALDGQGNILKELNALTAKNAEQDETLQFLKSRHEIITTQLAEIQRILRQFAEANLEGRLEIIEERLTKQQTLIGLFSSVPRPLQYLVLCSICIASIAWSVHLLSK